jgi:hypothetical protein
MVVEEREARMEGDEERGEGREGESVGSEMLLACIVTRTTCMGGCVRHDELWAGGDG